jgi:hypothetical protein
VSRFNLRSLGTVAQQIGQAATEAAQAVAQQVSERIISPVRSVLCHGAAQHDAERPATMTGDSSSTSEAHDWQPQLAGSHSPSPLQQMQQAQRTPDRTIPLRADGSQVRSRPQRVLSEPFSQQQSDGQAQMSSRHVSSRQYESPVLQRTDSLAKRRKRRRWHKQHQ